MAVSVGTVALTTMLLLGLICISNCSSIPVKNQVARVPLEFTCINPSAHSKVPTTSVYYALDLEHKADWDTAEELCKGEGKGSRLASIESAEELSCIANELDKLSPEIFWTAGRFVETLGWIWDIDNVPYPFAEFPPWASGQPALETAVSRASLHVTNAWDSTLHSVVKTEQYLPLCEVSEPVPVPCRNPNDLVLVVDSSGSIGADDFKLALTFVARLTNAFTPHVDTRFSFTVYSSDATTPIKLNSGLTPEQIDSLVLSTVYVGGGTETALGIEAATTELVANKRNVPQTFVVLTDGNSNDPAATAAAAQRALSQGIRTFAVGIGSGIDAAELLAIAGNIPENVYTLESFDQLIDVLVPISVKVCPAF